VAYRQILHQEQKQGRILPAWDSRTKMVERVMARLIEGGELGTGTAGQNVGWEINVIDDPSEWSLRCRMFLQLPILIS
jgi:hypothetical protein